MKNVLFLLLSTFACLVANSQDKGKIKGVLFDTMTLQGISTATVTVFKMSDSSIVNFVFSNNSGVFELNRLPLQTKLRLLISHVNYASFRKEFELTEENLEMNFDTIFFAFKVFEMEDVVVTGEKPWDRPPILFEGDTVSFHADAFLNRPGTVVEDLLRRIPGIEIGANGITMNGRNVSRILLDGREFFGTDPTMLLKNIPAMLVDKVKVTEEKDEFGNLTGSGDVTINVTLKQEAKNGNFGKAFAGYGTTDRFETGFMWNFFKDTMQISFLGWGNNLSQSGFSYTDVMSLGGFGRQNFRSTSRSSDGSFGVNGISFGGGSGITTSLGGGVNFSHVLFKKVDLNLSYFIGNVSTELSNKSVKEYLLSDSSFSSTSNANSLNKGLTHNFSGGFRVNIDSTSYINYRSSAKLSFRDNFREQEIANILGTNTNEIDNALESRVDNLEYSGRFYYSKNIRKKLTFNVWNSHRWSRENARDIYNQMALRGVNMIESESFDQNKSELIKKVNTETDFSVRYNWSPKWISSVNYNHEFDKTDNDIHSEQKLTTLNEFSRNDFLSGLLDYTVISQSVSKEIIFNDRKKRNIYASGEVGYTFFNLRANEQDRTFGRDNLYSRMTSSFLISKRAKTKGLWMNFSQRFSEPNLSQILPIIDNLNPRNIRFGNFNLEPSFNHNLSFGGNYLFEKIRLNVSTYGNGSITENAVIGVRDYDALGREISSFQNLSNQNTFNYYAMINLNKQFVLSPKWKMPLSFRTSYGGGKNYQILFSQTNELEFNNLSIAPGISFNKIDVLDLTFTYSRNLNNNQTSLNINPTQNIFHSINSTLWIKLPKGFSMEYQYDFNYQPFIQSGITTAYNLFNLSLNKSILKDQKGVLKLSVFDMFRQNINFGRTVTDNYIEEFRTNAVVRYVMLSFIYNVNTLKAIEQTRTRGKNIRWW